MMADEIQEDDEFVGSDGRVFWTALGRADEPYDGYSHVRVRFADGKTGDRWLPVGRDLPIRRPGVSF